MLELGESEMQAHREVGCRAGTVAQFVICVGERAKWIAEEAVACGAARDHVWHVADNAGALAVLRDLLQKRSVVLVKGSRGMNMEEIVTGLAEMAGSTKED
jgi:UDP-N-acetylmuramoyl-tripeptide--D-alanyl-D-alanine ligase